MKISRKDNHRFTHILFGDAIHLAYMHTELVGLQSWKSGPCFYAIELTFRSGAAIVSEYDSAEKWAQVISLVSSDLH